MGLAFAVLHRYMLVVLYLGFCSCGCLIWQFLHRNLLCAFVHRCMICRGGVLMFPMALWCPLQD